MGGGRGGGVMNDNWQVGDASDIWRDQPGSFSWQLERVKEQEKERVKQQAKEGLMERAQNG